MDGRIVRCGIISSRQSAATSEIVKRFLSRTPVRSVITSIATFTFTLCSYQWLKNGVLLEPPPWNFLYIGKGSVRITQLTALDEGFYQCLASNSHGTAMSNVTYLQRAVLDSYGGDTVVEEKVPDC